MALRVSRRELLSAFRRRNLVSPRIASLGSAVGVHTPSITPDSHASASPYDSPAHRTILSTACDRNDSFVRESLAQRFNDRVGDGGSAIRPLYTSGQAMPMVATSPARRAFLVDTLALVRRLEAEGLTAQQAEAITHLITEVLHDSLDSVAHTFVSKPDMQTAEMVAEAALIKLKAEVQSTFELKFAALQREVEGLKTGIDKVKSEIRYEVDKVTAGQRLDLNLEKGRVKEEMNLQLQELNNLTNKLDKETNNLKAQLEGVKFEIIRYCIGTLVSISAIGLGILRLVL